MIFSSFNEYLIGNGVYLHNIDTCRHIAHQYRIAIGIYRSGIQKHTAHAVNSNIFTLRTIHDDGISVLRYVHSCYAADIAYTNINRRLDKLPLLGSRTVVIIELYPLSIVRARTGYLYYLAAETGHKLIVAFASIDNDKLSNLGLQTASTLIVISIVSIC